MAEVLVHRPLSLHRRAGGRRAASDERIRSELARELHDSVCQTLTTMLVSMETFKRDMAGRESVQLKVDDLQDGVRDALSNLRRVLFDLRGQATERYSLSEALHALVARMQEMSEAEIRLSLSEAWPDDLPPHVHLNLYRIVEEAIRNAVSHSGAEHISVVLSDQGDYLNILVGDDGPGFPIQQAGLGLVGMRERALIVGADIEVLSEPGRGTTVEVLIPWGAAR